MSTVDILQALMFFSFSTSWYWSIAKLLRTKSATGKSLIFALMVCVGYGLGIASLVLARESGGELNPLIYVFSWNLTVTIIDALLVIRYSRPSPLPSSITPTIPSALVSPARELVEPARD